MDMLRVLEDDRTPFDLLMCLFLRLRNSKRRLAFDEIIRLVEHKRELAHWWGHVARGLLKKHRGSLMKQVQLEREAQEKESNKKKLVKRSLVFLLSVLGNKLRKQLRWGLEDIKNFADRAERPNKKEAKQPELDILPQQNFLLRKNDYELEPQVKVVEVAIEVPVQIAVEVPVKADPVTFELQTTNNMLHYVPEPKERCDDISSREGNPNGRSQLTESDEELPAVDPQNQQLLTNIYQQILELKSQFSEEAESSQMTSKEKVVVLERVTGLVESLKQYHVSVTHSKPQGNIPEIRDNLTHILKLIENIIGKLPSEPDETGMGGPPESGLGLAHRRVQTQAQKQKQADQHMVQDYVRNLRKEIGQILQFLEKPVKNLNLVDREEQSRAENEILCEMIGSLGQMKHRVAKQLSAQQRTTKYTKSRQKRLDPAARKNEDLFNLLGILNFKIKKQLQIECAKAFWSIHEHSQDKRFQMRLQKRAVYLAKNHVILEVNKLSIEVNRRSIVRRQTVYRLSKMLSMRLKRMLRRLRLNSRNRRGRTHRWNLTRTRRKPRAAQMPQIRPPTFQQYSKYASNRTQRRRSPYQVQMQAYQTEQTPQLGSKNVTVDHRVWPFEDSQLQNGRNTLMTRETRDERDQIQTPGNRLNGDYEGSPKSETDLEQTRSKWGPSAVGRTQDFITRNETPLASTYRRGPKKYSKFLNKKPFGIRRKRPVSPRLAGEGDSIRQHSIRSLNPKLYLSKHRDDNLYMNLEEEYLHRVSKRLGQSTNLSINRSMYNFK